MSDAEMTNKELVDDLFEIVETLDAAGYPIAAETVRIAAYRIERPVKD